MTELAVTYTAVSPFTSGSTFLSEKEASSNLPEAPSCASAVNFFVSKLQRIQEALIPSDAAFEALKEKARWYKYLIDLESDPVSISPELANSVLGTWFNIENRLGTALKPPVAGPGGELGFQLVWQNDEQYLEIDIGANHQFEWFYKNLSSGEVAGTEEDPITESPEELLQKLVTIISAQ